MVCCVYLTLKQVERPIKYWNIPALNASNSYVLNEMKTIQWKILCLFGTLLHRPLLCGRSACGGSLLSLHVCNPTNQWKSARASRRSFHCKFNSQLVLRLADRNFCTWWDSIAKLRKYMGVVFKIKLYRVIIRIKPRLHQCLCDNFHSNSRFVTYLIPRLRLGIK